MSTKENIFLGLKILFLVVSAIGVFSIVGPEDDCQVIKSWKGMGEYTVKRYKCDDRPASMSESLRLYKKDKRIARDGEFNYWNNCWVEFKVASEYHITVNVCEKTILERSPDKKELIASKIDSVYLFRGKVKSPRMLSRKHIQLLIKQWDQKSALGHFFPNSKQDKQYVYKMKVFTPEEIREFSINMFTIKELGDWNYRLPVGSGIFDKFWKESAER